METIRQSFIKSLFTEEGAFYQCADVIDWLKRQNESVSVQINKIPFSLLKEWYFDTQSGSLRHDSGKFFSIDGIQVNTNFGNIPQWDQPIINQPEIGYLGFIVQEFKGVLHFLMQAKIEPGNINHVQLSPTLQATKSNYTKVHQGKSPNYLEYFLNVKPHQVIVDQLQSEQGARFLHKRNRNIIIKVDEPLPLKDNFIWLTLGQIKKLLQQDNLINMDSRTVLSEIPLMNVFSTHPASLTELPGKSLFLDSTFNNESCYHSFESILSFITKQKVKYELTVHHLPLTELNQWVVGENEIYHETNQYFKIIAAEITIDNREVAQWTQPLVEPAQNGIYAFVCKEINGILHFAVQCKLECGNFDIIELAPTVQCLTGNYHTSNNALPFLNYILNIPANQIIFDTYQSEEGGRFYREQNRNLLVIAGDEIDLDLPENFIWMTLHQLNLFIKFNNYVNIQARSLIAAIPFNYQKRND